MNRKYIWKYLQAGHCQMETFHPVLLPTHGGAEEERLRSHLSPARALFVAL